MHLTPRTAACDGRSMAKKRPQQSEDNGERRDPEVSAESRREDVETAETETEEPAVDADKLDLITEAHEADVVQKMGLHESYFGAKAAEALCAYGAHGDLADLDRAARFIQRERTRLVTSE